MEQEIHKQDVCLLMNAGNSLLRDQECEKFLPLDVIF